MEQDSLLNRAARICFALLCIGGAIYIAFRWLLEPLMPFLLAGAAALLLRPAAELLSKKLRISIRITAPLVLLAVAAALSCGVYFAARRLLDEGIRLLNAVAGNAGTILDAILLRLEAWSDRLPFLTLFVESERGIAALSDAIVPALTGFAAKLPGFLAEMAAKLPDALLYLLVTLLAACYLTVDLPRLYQAALRPFSREAVERWEAGRRKIAQSCKHLLGAYGSILLLTFAELWIGFLILRVEYAFTLALLIAVIDILPVLGVGSVLIPWALGAALFGDTYTAAGLLLLFGVISLIRQIIEPHMIGRSVGLHPLLSLGAMYAGLKLMGVPGLIIMPCLALLLRDRLLPVNEEGEPEK